MKEIKWTGPSLREMRRDFELTQTEFSEMFNIPLRVYQSWEGYEKNPKAQSTHRPASYVYSLIYQILYKRKYED